MEFNVGDLVTRKSYKNDVVFKIVSIDSDTVYLKGVNIRLVADADISDLLKNNSDVEKEKEFLSRVETSCSLNRNDYFYLPGKILHIDSDVDYLNRCLEYYKKLNVWAMGINENEEDVPKRIKDLLDEYKPNIVVITGHDAYYKKAGKSDDLKSYKSSSYFADSIRKAREYENSHEKLIIIAGACSSYFEELIRAGANFASSPKRINIHALDPAIIAAQMSLADINKDINLKEVLEKTKYGKDGIGGIITKGTMYVGYPR